MVAILGDRRSSSLVGSVERKESSPRVIYSIPFSTNLVASLGNLKVVLDKLLWFHIQASAFFGFLGFFSRVISIEDRLVELDVLSPLLVVPPSSLWVCGTWGDQVRAQSCPCRPEGHSRGSFPMNFLVILWFLPSPKWEQLFRWAAKT